MNRYLLLILIGLLFAGTLYAQGDVEANEQDSIMAEYVYFDYPDSVFVSVDSLEKLPAIEKIRFKPDPNKAILYSLLPGGGQIYNRKYWKLPIVYGGLMGCVYAITWNGQMYDGYKGAYNDFTNAIKETPPANTGTSWYDYVPVAIKNKVTEAGGNWKNAKDWNSSDATWFSSSVLKNGKDGYRRYRDLSYFITAGLYAIFMIDAYVDAQLFDFDISEDLSFRVDPVFTPSTSFSSRTMGVQCSFTF